MTQVPLCGELTNSQLAGLPTGFLRMRLTPKAACALCQGTHHPFLCTRFATLAERKRRLDALKLCQNFLAPKHEECRQLDNQCCKWFNCVAKGQHNTVTCPPASYPVPPYLYKPQ